MIILNDGQKQHEIQEHSTEWAMAWAEPSGELTLVPASNEAEARLTAERAGASVVSCETFTTKWEVR